MVDLELFEIYFILFVNCCICFYVFLRKKIFYKFEEIVSCIERLEKNNDWMKYNIIVKG